LDWTTISISGLIMGVPFLGVSIGVIGKRWIDYKEKALALEFAEQNRRILQLRTETEDLTDRLVALEKGIVDDELARTSRQRSSPR